MDLLGQCRWLHEGLDCLPSFSFPFRPEQLPENGIYFFYENGELWGHGGTVDRIVRIGTHKDGNFRNRICEHYLLDDRKMRFDATVPAPKDRSIFRKHIGRAILNNRGDPYLDVWEIDFTYRDKRDQFGHLRNIEKEMETESAVTELLRKKFFFRFVLLEGQAERIGKSGLESRLIATAAQCPECRASKNWLGLCSSKPQIRSGKLWQVQHLRGKTLDERDREAISVAVRNTKQWLAG